MTPPIHQFVLENAAPKHPVFYRAGMFWLISSGYGGIKAKGFT